MTKRKCSNCGRADSSACRDCSVPADEMSTPTHWVPIKGTAPPRDDVNHPFHYETGKFECIDVMEETQGVDAVLDFCICNAFKYLYRHRKKNGIEDIKKARWYLDKFIEIFERSERQQ